MATASRKEPAVTKPKHSVEHPNKAESAAHTPSTQSTAPTPVEPVKASPFKFAIESNVPLPTKRIVQKGETAYPFAVLEVGQSFFVPSSDRMKEPWKTLTSMASRTSRDLHPKRFTTARATSEVDGKPVEGVRIWRLEDTDKPLAEPKKINRKPRKDSEEGKRLAAEAIAGDTSQRQHPEPDFDTPAPGGNPPPPPPPPAS